MAFLDRDWRAGVFICSCIFSYTAAVEALQGVVNGDSRHEILTRVAIVFCICSSALPLLLLDVTARFISADATRGRLAPAA